MNTKPQDEQQDMIAVESLLALYAVMARIREVELKIEALYGQDEMKTPIHLSLGQEAVAAGVCAHLGKDDLIFSNHRSHAHYLAKGGGLRAMIAELYCRATGCAQGRGGSMHLIDRAVGHLGSSAIVAGSIPHAVGAALAFRLQGKSQVAVSFFGDAASEQGVFFESMGLAALKRLPVVFVCENNRYSVCSHISARQVNPDIMKRPRAFDIPALKADGMDVADVYRKAAQALDHARGGQGPFFIECDVQRWRGHAGAADPGRELYRVEDDLKPGWPRDPVADLQKELLERRGVDPGRLRFIQSAVAGEIEDAFRFARNSALPDKNDLEKFLFA